MQGLKQCVLTLKPFNSGATLWCCSVMIVYRAPGNRPRKYSCSLSTSSFPPSLLSSISILRTIAYYYVHMALAVGIWAILLDVQGSPRKDLRHSGWAWFGRSLWPYQSFWVTTSKTYMYGYRRHGGPLCWKGLGRTLTLYMYIRVGRNTALYVCIIVGTFLREPCRHGGQRRHRAAVPEWWHNQSASQQIETWSNER